MDRIFKCGVRRHSLKLEHLKSGINQMSKLHAIALYYTYVTSA